MNDHSNTYQTVHFKYFSTVIMSVAQPDRPRRFLIFQFSRNTCVHHSNDSFGQFRLNIVLSKVS